ncbi:MAG: MFS transporter [Lachnospiraceae bacterium]|nr:MFS transporter [Lachnospiraceae bacterium]
MELKTREKVAYGIGAVGKDLVYMLTASFILYYFEDVLGIGAVSIGVLLMVARVFDAINDPFMGVIVAKTRTKYGKFRPWLLGGTVLNAIVLFIMFSAPRSFGEKQLLIFAWVTYILWGVTYTMMDIPYWSMIPAFAHSSKEREGLAQMARTCAGVGSAIATVITMMMVYQLGGGDERLGFSRFALIVAVIFVLTAVFMFLSIQEKSTVEMETTSVGEMFRALISNDQAVAVVIVIVLFNCSIYLTSNLVIYFFKYDFGGEGWRNAYTMFNTFGGAVQILSMMILYPAFRKLMNIKKTFYAAIAMAVMGYCVLLILASSNMQNLFLLFIPGFFIFGANGLVTVMTTVFLANSVDYGEVKNGHRDESVIFSMQTFVVKLASGVAALLASLCLGIFHISDNADAAAEAAASSIMGLRLTMTVIPVIGLIIVLVSFSRRFKLTEEKMEEIAEQLRK